MELNLSALDEGEILRYLGCPPEGDTATLELVRACLPELLGVIKPRYIYNVYSIFPEAEGVRLDTGLLLPGEALKTHLAGCDKAVVMACTLSAQADALLRRAEAQDMARALVLDACASAAVEAVCDEVEAEIHARFPGCSFPFRFSPGYGDLPLTVQGELLHLVDAPRKIGLCATATHLLTPRKSVTALLGVAPGGGARRGERSCDHCALSGRCAFRKVGNHCATA